MIMENDRKLGVLGALGFLSFWMVCGYGFLAAMGYGFLSDINYVDPRMPLAWYGAAFERDYSELAPIYRKLETQYHRTRRSLGFLEIAEMDGSLVRVPGGGVRYTVASLGFSLDSDGMKRWYEQTPSMKKAWERWKRDATPIIVIPDGYGFPYVPNADEKTLARWFPSYPETFRLRALFDGRRTEPPTLVEQVGECGWDGSQFSFPLVWRMNEFGAKREQKKAGLHYFLIVAIIGGIATLMLMRWPMPDVGEIEILRSFAIGFGLFSLLSLPTYRTCYSSRDVTDDEVIEPRVLEMIRKDCRAYLDDLQRESKISNDDKQMMLKLLNRR